MFTQKETFLHSYHFLIKKRGRGIFIGAEKLCHDARLFAPSESPPPLFLVPPPSPPPPFPPPMGCLCHRLSRSLKANLLVYQMQAIINLVLPSKSLINQDAVSNANTSSCTPCIAVTVTNKEACFLSDTAY